MDPPRRAEDIKIQRHQCKKNNIGGQREGGKKNNKQTEPASRMNPVAFDGFGLYGCFWSCILVFI